MRGHIYRHIVLQTTIEKEAANIAVQDSAIEDLAGQIATDEADLKAATEIREKEAAAFSAEEKDGRSLVHVRNCT